MTGQAVLRALIIIALIVTANAVKPFSVRNVTNQIFSAADSLRIVLPDSAEVGLSNANLLAVTLTRSWFSEDVQPVWYGDEDVLAYQQPGVEQEAPAAPVKMGKAVIDRPAGRTRRDSATDESEELAAALLEGELAEILSEDAPALSPTAIAFSGETASVENTAWLETRSDLIIPARYEAVRAPVSLPDIESIVECTMFRVRPVINQDQLRQVPFWRTASRVAPRSGPGANCDEQTGNQIRLITFIEQKRKAKVDAVLTSMLECEDEITEIKSEAPVVISSGEASNENSFTFRVAPLQIIQGENNSCNPLQ